MAGRKRERERDARTFKIAPTPERKELAGRERSRSISRRNFTLGQTDNLPKPFRRQSSRSRDIFEKPDGVMGPETDFGRHLGNGWWDRNANGAVRLTIDRSIETVLLRISKFPAVYELRAEN